MGFFNSLWGKFYGKKPTTGVKIERAAKKKTKNLTEMIKERNKMMADVMSEYK